MEPEPERGGEKLILRDKLALARTYLAKERTILAYMRTGIAMLGLAVFIYRFMDIGIVFEILLFIALVVPGTYATVYGIHRTLVRRRERKELEEELGLLKK